MGEPINSQTPSTPLAIIVLAWVGMLLATTLPGIIVGQSAQTGAGDPLWVPVSSVQVGGLALLLLVTLLWPTAKPLRLALLMLLAFVIGWRVLTPLAAESAAWVEWQASQPIGVSLVISRLQWLPPILLMTLVALGAGLSRRQMFLARGDWTKVVSPDPLFPFKGWSWFPKMFVLFLLVGFVFTAPQWVIAVEPDFSKVERILTHLPGILAASAANAFCEECIFRVALLACFIAALGVRQALGLTAVLFGLEHWQTAGIAVVFACYCGWIYAKSMTETGGWSWALVQHFLGDVPIYAIIAMARP